VLLSGDVQLGQQELLVYENAKDVHHFWFHLERIQWGQDLLNDPNFLSSPINKIGEPSTVLIRKEVCQKVGNFDLSFSQLVDLELWIRIMVHYKIGFINQTLSTFRIHFNQQTLKNNQSGQSFLDHRKFTQKLLTNEDYNLLPELLKNNIFERRIIEAEDDLLWQLERSQKRIIQLEEYEQELETRWANTQQKLELADSEIVQLKAVIEGMESSKFWQMREAWMQFKGFLMGSEEAQKNDLFLIFFNAQKLVKTFLFSLTEEGISIALSRTRRKIIKLLTGTASLPIEEDVRKYAQLSQPKPLQISTSLTPIISIIIPVYNKYLYTFNCLKAILKNGSSGIEFEIIIVDDCSSDETPEKLSEISGIQVIRNAENLGFIRSCNAGAAKAQGQYLYFLNNDTQILAGCLENLLSLIEKDTTIGAVGSKLIYPNGKLQEAGGIIWQDATGWNYGRLDEVDQPEYNYVREVDYCSGASLLVRTEIFQQLGGFSEQFLPAYYEDTDLCFAMRQLGYQVLYQPKSQVIHHEGISSGTSLDSGIKQYQVVNQSKFFSKWQEALKTHFLPDAKNVPQAARRLCYEKTILVIDSYVPLYDRESGCVRLLEILKILLNLKYHIIFLPDNGNPEEPYTSTLQEMGIEVLYGTPKQQDIQALLINRLPLVDIVWLCRPELCEKYLDLIRNYSKAPVIYDTIDLHFLRIKRQKEVLSENFQNTNWSWETYQKLEIKFARQANATLVVTELEQQTLNQLGVSNVSVIPNIHHPRDRHLKSFEERSGLLFIGSYNHLPNIDAVIWLAQEIMPLIWQAHPEIQLTLLGSNLKDEVRALASDRILVKGYVKDVEPDFLNSRVFVAPLRFGAGMKGKIGQSMSYGLPTVTTTIGAEGMGLQEGYDVLIADGVESFARQVISLYENDELWNHLARNSQQTIAQYSPEAVQEKLQALLSHLSPRNSSNDRSRSVN
jgi:GT2 family glycosyltransferase/glycosyltransferase involved in cell wall biosynthesis